MTAHDPRLDALTAEAAAEARPQTEDAERRLVAVILGGVAVLVALWAAAVAVFGLAGLILPAVAAVPVIFQGLILLTWG
ncbi:MAG: hypothetical protein ACE368_05835 [Paracoccaceae bacterium]